MAAIFRQLVDSLLEITNEVELELVADEKHPDWVRWIYSSINKHFINTKGALPMYLEGDERTFQDEAEFYELRIDGPFILQPQKDEYLVDMQINVLIQTHMDSRRLYNMQEAVGQVSKAFTNAICVFKYGDYIFDDQTLLGVLKLRTKMNEGVDINYFGIIKEDTRLTQATVEGHYRMEISNGSN
jgi:hypothetical protein